MNAESLCVPRDQPEKEREGEGERKNPGFYKDKTDVMFGLTLYDFASFISLYV